MNTLSRYLSAMALRRSQEPARLSGPASPLRVSMRLEPSIEPAERRQWALIVIAVIAVFGIAAASMYWLMGAEQKPIAETAKPSFPPKPSAPAAPIQPLPRLS
jgi:hypothetical protein